MKRLNIAIAVALVVVLAACASVKNGATPEVVVAGGGEMVTAVPATPLWSPDGSRFVYQDPVTGLSIFDSRNEIAYPLALSGSDRLLDPQWSFDGTFLSVTVLQEYWWERETAVLRIP